MRESANPLRVSAHTLGCKVNQYDTGRLLDALAERGYEVVGMAEPADVRVVNTCAVTRTGETKSLQMLRRVKAANPGAVLAVCGCLAKANEQAAREAGADIVFDAREPDGLTAWLEARFNKTRTGLAEPAGSAKPRGGKRTRAYIKIQDGCDRFCSYCIVPHLRGELVSRPLDEILAEARSLIAERGVREIVLTGIQSAAYGKDMTNGGGGFPGVIKAVAALPGLTRLRLGSVEPYAVTDEFLDAVSAPVVCPHFHLSLQSGCDKTLRAMNRRYTSAEYAGLAGKLRKVKPGAALTTDIMAGFPGETEADFEESLRFAEAMRFSRMHVFVFSPREGTPAAGFPNQIGHAEKTRRGARLRELAASMEFEFLKEHLGRTEPVLFESGRDGVWEGHTSGYITVRAPFDGDPVNTLIDVKLDEIKNGIIYGGIVL